MKKINLTVSYEEEKVKALRWYLEQKGTRLEEELVKAVDTLFNKNVPANVRNYICKDEDAPPAAEAPMVALIALCSLSTGINSVSTSPFAIMEATNWGISVEGVMGNAGITSGLICFIA